MLEPLRTALPRLRLHLLGFAVCAALAPAAGPHPAAAGCPGAGTDEDGDPLFVCLVSNISTNEDQPFSLPYSIELANTAEGDELEQSIEISEVLRAQTLTLDETLPAVMVGTNGFVRFDGSTTPGFMIRAADTVPEDFVLFEVTSGQATLVDLDIAGGAFKVNEGATLAFEYEGPFVVSDAIIGDGRILKLGDELLELSGENTYTGGTVIETGELRGDTEALVGAISIEEDATLHFRTTELEEITTIAVSGEGKLIKSGPGLLEWNNEATHTGGTEVQAGTLMAQPDFINSDVNVSAGAELVLDQPAGDANFMGSITGAGKLIVANQDGGDLLLSGANTISGGFTIKSGTVTGEAQDIPGNVELDAGTTLKFSQNNMNVGTHAGNITGRGSVEKVGLSNVVLTGTSSYTGGTTVRSGTLAGDTRSLNGDISVHGDATLEFDFSDTQTLNAVIDGNGQLLKSGGGTLIYDSDQQYTGATVINAGALTLNVDLPQTAGIFVNEGARLNSTTSVGGFLYIAGVMDIGTNPASIFEVGGDLTFEPGSTFSLTLDSNPKSSGQIHVTGTAEINGGTVNVIALPDTYSAQTYDIILVDGGGTVTGAGFTLVTPSYAFLDITMADPMLDNTKVSVQVVPNSNGFTEFAETPNQASTALAANQIVEAPAGLPDLEEVQDAFFTLTESEVPPTLEALSGETLSGFTNSRLANAQEFALALSRRFTASRFEPDPDRRRRRRRQQDDDFELLPMSLAGKKKSSGFGAWMDPFGVFGRVESNDNWQEMSTNAFGVNGGFDYRLPADKILPGSEHLRFGLGLGYARHNIDNAARTMEGLGNTFQTALYGAWQSHSLHVGAAFRYAYSDLQTTRRISIGTAPPLDRIATASFDGHEYGAVVEAGYRIALSAKVDLEPLANFQYTLLTQSALQEIGAGSLSLAADEMQVNSLLTTLALRLSRLYTLRGKYGMEPELRAGWSYEAGDRGRHVTARFAHVPNADPFITAGAELDRSSFWFGVGYVMTLGDVPLLSAQYDLRIGQRATWHLVSIGTYFRW